MASFSNGWISSEHFYGTSYYQALKQWKFFERVSIQLASNENIHMVGLVLPKESDAIWCQASLQEYETTDYKATLNQE